MRIYIHDIYRNHNYGLVPSQACMASWKGPLDMFERLENNGTSEAREEHHTSEVDTVYIM